MKVVSLLGSPRSQGSSATIASHLTETASGLGAQIHSFELNRLSYRGCQGCYLCKKKLDHCVLDDDLTEVLATVQQADVVVLASPVYYGDLTSQLKGFIDRTFSYLKPDYLTSTQPSRLTPKKLVLILTQGHPDPALFGDIFGRYAFFMKWMGFTEVRLIRACGLGPRNTVPEEVLREAEAAARELCGQIGQPVGATSDKAE
ncbi:MAG: flavodoxin family protein [Desulfuromonadales bacterium]|nr:flavodoxin family protein [Desulfuromonadales bacterium]